MVTLPLCYSTRDTRRRSKSSGPYSLSWSLWVWSCYTLHYFKIL